MHICTTSRVMKCNRSRYIPTTVSLRLHYVYYYYNIPFKNKYFDLIIGFSSIYKYNFNDVVKTILEINRVSKNSFLTVASYSNKKEKELFDKWTLLGTTILKKKDWLELFKILKYKGDYYFTTAKSLNLY